jgi:hypothetical protein
MAIDVDGRKTVSGTANYLRHKHKVMFYKFLGWPLALNTACIVLPILPWQAMLRLESLLVQELLFHSSFLVKTTTNSVTVLHSPLVRWAPRCLAPNPRLRPPGCNHSILLVKHLAFVNAWSPAITASRRVAPRHATFNTLAHFRGSHCITLSSDRESRSDRGTPRHSIDHSSTVIYPKIHVCWRIEVAHHN